MKVVEQLTASVRSAALHNKEVQAAPTCILWTDSERQWESAIPRLQKELPELLVLGSYDPDNRTGPAIWLRCAIANKTEGLVFPPEVVPVIYLPGVSRQDLRAVESCPEKLKPLAELQYRGVIWSQLNGKDWTIVAFLKTKKGGLGLDVSPDVDTKSSALGALKRLLDEEISAIQHKRLDRDFFNGILTGGDPIRDLLKWIDNDELFKATKEESEWLAFVELISSRFGFNPEKDGVLMGATNLATRGTAWSAVWERYSEAPHLYPNIPNQMRRCSPPTETIFWLNPNDDTYTGWVQWNELQEKTLRSELNDLSNFGPTEARSRISELENAHGHRRSAVWAKIGLAPLAAAIGSLAALAEKTSVNFAVGTIKELEAHYISDGWVADDMVMRSLENLDTEADISAVSNAVVSVYLPWIEESARYLQKLVEKEKYPGGSCKDLQMREFDNSICVLFVDGLRFDSAKRLVKMLQQVDLKVEEMPNWCALPSVTATGKAAVSPVGDKFTGPEESTDFEPSVKKSNQSLKGGYHFKKTLKDEGWNILEKGDNGNGDGRAWCEFGDIDHEGHDRGWKLAKHLDALLLEIRNRVSGLISSGWKRVHIVTDHGWLLMPNGLPKTELQSALVSTKWGRCASIKPGASTEERLFPWYWNSHVQFALSDGVSCFKAGQEYAHGGLSLQECLTLELTITRAVGGNSEFLNLSFTEVIWKGMRCSVVIEGTTTALKLDIRKNAGDPSSSVSVKPKDLKQDGTTSIVVEDEDLEGKPAVLILIDKDNKLVAQINTIIGG